MKNMTQERLFENVPLSYLYCYNSGCELCEKCMHYLAAEHGVPKEKIIQVVTPVATEGGKCAYYKEMKMVRMAYGMKHIYDKVLANDIAPLRQSIISHFGNGSYYRQRNGVKPITPKEQQFIARQFAAHGYAAGVEFDDYRDELEW